MTDGHMDAKVLRRAAEIVEQGHCKGSFAITATGMEVFEDEPDAVAWCARGAMFLAQREIYGPDDLGQRHADLCDLVQGVANSATEVAQWNDAPERTADEVAAALRLAADRCDSASPEPVSGDAR